MQERDVPLHATKALPYSLLACDNLSKNFALRGKPSKADAKVHTLKTTTKYYNKFLAIIT